MCCCSYPNNDMNAGLGPKPTTFSVSAPAAIAAAVRACRRCHCLAAVPAGADSLTCCVQGTRALDFVLKNRGLIDKTLLFDIELVRVS